MEEQVTHNYPGLRALLAEPELFDPADLPHGREYLHSASKGALDAALGLAVIPITGLPTLAGMAAITLVDHTNPLFRQYRVGYRGEEFVINKLTTMPGAPEDTHSNGRHDDVRRSKVGRMLSLLRIDESPQLINVAHREMSVIGPRPLIPSYLKEVRYAIGSKEADEWMKVRSLALPGIFDDFSNQHHSYQLDGDPAEQLRQRIVLEKAYILERASLKEDLRILRETLGLFAATALRHSGFARKAKEPQL